MHTHSFLLLQVFFIGMGQADDDLETAVKLLRLAKEQGAETYLKGCVNYIIRMKPENLEIRNAED